MTNGGGPSSFTERGLPYVRPGVDIQIAVTEVLYEGRSDYGHVQILDTPFFGKLLVLDGIIQTSALDEFIYHEMIVHTPTIRFGAPERMLVVGGGDGGAIRQALRVTSLREIVMVEIDAKVMELCRRFLPEISGDAFDDPKVDIVVDDGAAYVRRNTRAFDVIVLDLTDPVPGGPAEQLFTEAFFRAVREALTPGGVVSLHGGSLLFQPAGAGVVAGRLGQVFPQVTLHVATVPAYQLSPFAFLNATTAPLPGATEVRRRFDSIAPGSRYLTPELYLASTVLPVYQQDQVGQAAWST